MNTGSHVLVVGSANIDVSVTARALPRRGETVIGTSSAISVGGKGANQAAAAAACGASTQLIARVGTDEFGRMVRDELRARSIGILETKALPDSGTGMAAIYVEDSGDNCIVVVPGANARLGPADIDAGLALIRDAAVVVVQCEIPVETVYRTIELSAEYDIPVILNPAPFHALDLARIARCVTYLVPNETEASQLCGKPVETVNEAKDCASWLHELGIACVIVTLGAQGCVVADNESVRHMAAYRVKAVDTTGAGDAFIGCLAESLAAGRALDESIRRAVIYSALYTTARGALASFPRRDEVSAWTDSALAGES
jgi:ribokinase